MPVGQNLVRGFLRRSAPSAPTIDIGWMIVSSSLCYYR